MAKSVRTLSVYINLNSKNFTKGLRRLERRLGRLGKRLQNVGATMTRNISVPMAMAGAGAVKLASDFNESMTKIQTLVGTSGDEVEKLKSQVLELAGETAQAPKDLADGLFFIQSAGFKGTEGMEALEVSAKGAAMGMGELTDIANATTSIMTAYAHENMTAAQAGDLLHETLKQGKFEAGEFMNKIGQVLPTAASFGISFEQLGASIATMSKLSGDAAGSLTAVNQLMMKLNAPSEQQLDILNKLFGSYDNLSKSLKSDFMGTLNQIFTGLEGNDLALTKVFGSAKAVKAAFATAGLQGEVYAEVLEGMNQSAGNLSKGFAVVSEESSFKFKKALADLKVAGIQLGNIIMPMVTKLVEKISELIQKFTNLSSNAKKRIIQVAASFALLGPALSLLGSITLAVKGLVGWIRTLGVVSRATALVFALFNPYTYLFVALGLIIAGFVKHFEKLKQPIVDVVNWMVTLYNENQFVKKSIEGIIFWFKMFKERTLLRIKQVVDAAKNLGKILLNLLDKDKRAQAVADFFADYEKNQKEFATSVQEAWDQMKTNVENRQLKVISVNDINKAIEDGKEWGKKFSQGVKDRVKELWKGMGDFMFVPKTQTKEPFDENQQWRPPLALGVGVMPEPDFIGPLNQQLEKVKQVLSQFQLSTIESFNDTFNQMAQTLNGFAANYAESFSDMVSTTIVEGGNMADAFRDFMTQMLKDITAMIIKMMVFKALMAAFGIPTVGGGGGGGIGKMLGNIFGFSKGGIVTSPVMGIVGEGRNINASNPEIIAPLSDLRKHLGGGNSRLHGSIYGNDILLSNTRSTITQDRIGGSVTNF